MNRPRVSTRSAGLTPPPSGFPAVTHARALASHLAYGSAVALLLAAGRD